MDGIYSVSVELQKNRLYLRLSGALTDTLLKAFADAIAVEVKKLKTGYTVINDISTFTPASSAGLEEIQRAQKIIQDHGCSRVIRVINPKNMTVKLQFQRVGKQAYTLAGTETANSLAEAERMLEQDQ